MESRVEVICSEKRAVQHLRRSGISRVHFREMVRQGWISPIDSRQNGLFLMADIYQLKLKLKVAKQMLEIENREQTQLNLLTPITRKEVHM